jgi:hypothetical protein
VVGLPLLIGSSKKNKVFLWEYLILVLPVLIWNFLTMSGVGSQSLSNVSEVYILAIAVGGYSFFRLKKSNWGTNQKILGTVVLLLLPVALRLLFPSLPE